MATCLEGCDQDRSVINTPARNSRISLAVSMTLGSLGISMPYVALPALTDAFDVSLLAVQWVVTGYLLSVTTLVVGAGRLGDMFGPRKVLLIGLGTFVAGSVICAAAPSLWVLVMGRAVQGAGAAALMAMPLVIARQTTAKAEVGRVMGLLGTMSAIGTALGPALGGVLTAEFGWRAIFVALVPLSILCLWLVIVGLRACGPAAEKRTSSGFDIAGTVLMGLSVGVYTFALSGAHGVFLSFGWFLIAVAGVGAFVLVELRARTPLIQLTMLQDGKLVSGLASNMLTSIVMMATLVVGPFYLSRGLGLDASAVGFVVSVGPVIAALSGIPAGRIVDRFGIPAVLVAGLVQILTGCVGLALLTREFGVFGYVTAIAVVTSGYQLFLAANNTAVMIGAREDQRGLISGLLTLSRNLGLSTGASLMGGIFAALVGGAVIGSADDVARGMNITFAFAGLLVLIALVVVISNRLQREPETGE